MAGNVEYELSQTAYIKLVLHALRHPSCPIHGVLLGKAVEEGSGTTVAIEDAIPFFHSRTALAPMLELAFMQVDEFCQQQPKGQKLSIVGSYHGNEIYSDRELGGFARRMADQVSKQLPQACVLLLDNDLLSEAVKSKVNLPAVQLYTWDAVKSWRTAGDGGKMRLREPTAAGLLVDYVGEERYREVVDFDDHLEDISRDWLNPDLFR